MQFVVSGLMNSCSLVTKYIVTVAHVSRITTLALPEQWTMCTMSRHRAKGPLVLKTVYSTPLFQVCNAVSTSLITLVFAP